MLDCRGAVERPARVFAGAGVIGIGFGFFRDTEASESGGEGGEVCSVEVSDFVGGGVEAVGLESDVADRETSDDGDRGRNMSTEIGVGFLTLWRSMISSACFNLP